MAIRAILHHGLDELLLVVAVVVRASVSVLVPLCIARAACGHEQLKPVVMIVIHGMANCNPPAIGDLREALKNLLLIRCLAGNAGIKSETPTARKSNFA